ncbi:MAG: FeoB small GTPase domain-containing protein [Nostocaceae cyanobacterium]|nr:FeoB small GTPase domain-containing protein [Nostocaceae cyanobacterium]
MSCDSCHQSCHTRTLKSRWNWLNIFQKNRVISTSTTQPKIALVGSPNVGKSLLFNVLTGAYVTVSNYPGTTVEVSRGKAEIGMQPVMVIDTPGMYSLLPITEEEKVARDLLFSEEIDLVIHVVDAKNLGRMLALTFQLIESKLPVILAVNMIDEAEKLGIQVDGAKLENTLGIPVITMAAALKVGIADLKARVAAYV